MTREEADKTFWRETGVEVKYDPAQDSVQLIDMADNEPFVTLPRNVVIACLGALPAEPEKEQ